MYTGCHKTVPFDPVTSEEIAAEEAANARLIVARSKSVNKPTNNVIVYETGEGGHVVEFQATAEEIAVADAENAKPAAFRAQNARKAARNPDSQEFGLKSQTPRSGEGVETS